jgi:hypothetical protein
MVAGPIFRLVGPGVLCRLIRARAQTLWLAHVRRSRTVRRPITRPDQRFSVKMDRGLGRAVSLIEEDWQGTGRRAAPESVVPSSAPARAA